MKNILITSVILIGSLFSQGPLDVLRPFWGFEHSQILSNSIGGATVASGYITPGLTSNPANLAAIQFGYIQLNYSDSEFSSNTSNMTNTGFNGIDFVQPVPVYKGRLVFSAGGHKKIDFMSASNNDSEKGKLSSYHLATAVEFSKNLYLGADLRFLRGENEMIEDETNMIYYYKPRYSGANLTFGLLHILSKNLQYGISIDMPTSLSVEEQYTELDHVDSDLSFSQVYNYDVKKPITFHAGAALLFKSINFFYEVEQTDWRNLEFLSDDYALQDILDINDEIKDEFIRTISHHFGAAMRLPIIPVHLFAGYQYLPVPFSPSSNQMYFNDIRESYSFGVSVAIKKNITLQGSYDSYSWEFGESPESFDKISVGISLHDISGF